MWTSECVHADSCPAALTSLGPQTLDSLYRKLQLVPGFDATIDELDMFLLAVKAEGVLSQRSDGRYIVSK